MRKGSGVRDMVFVYADTSTKQQLRQEAATLRQLQLREQEVEKLGSGKIPDPSRTVSDLEQNPSSKLPQMT